MSKAETSPEAAALSKRRREATIRSLLHHAAEKIGGKEKDRDLLEPATHVCRLVLTLNVLDGPYKGETLEVTDCGELIVNADSTRGSSVGPKPEEVLAKILAKQSQTMRDYYLFAFPKEVRENGGKLADVDEDLVKQVAKMLKQMRAEQPATAVKGSVSFNRASAA